MKRVLMAGAGSCQLNAIRKLKALGYEVVVADPMENSPGKAIADHGVLADAFEWQELRNAAIDFEVDGLLTVGTDQPVLAISRVAEAIGLPMWLDSKTALSVTNKKRMKEIFFENNIPTVAFVFERDNFTHLPFEGPYVVKPIDSQGQRGIFKCHNALEVKEAIPKSLVFSREKEVLIEKFYPNDEVTVSGYVFSGDVKIFTITDRITFDADLHLGVCVAHEGPSKHVDQYGDELILLTQKICKVFGIHQGPIYFQFLIGKQGVMVNEIASRVGGAYEDVTIPYATGVDILDLNISDVLGDEQKLSDFRYQKNHLSFSVELFFVKAGKVVSRTPVEEVKALPFVLDFGYNFDLNSEIKAVENASQRAGFAILKASTRAELKENVLSFYKQMTIEDEQGNSLLLNRGQ